MSWIKPYASGGYQAVKKKTCNCSKCRIERILWKINYNKKLEYLKHCDEIYKKYNRILIQRNPERG